MPILSLLLFALMNVLFFTCIGLIIHNKLYGIQTAQDPHLKLLLVVIHALTLSGCLGIAVGAYSLWRYEFDLSISMMDIIVLFSGVMALTVHAQTFNDSLYQHQDSYRVVWSTSTKK